MLLLMYGPSAVVFQVLSEAITLVVPSACVTCSSRMNLALPRHLAFSKFQVATGFISL